MDFAIKLHANKKCVCTRTRVCNFSTSLKDEASLRYSSSCAGRILDRRDASSTARQIVVQIDLERTLV